MGVRKTQILLGEKNSAWGVIVNPVASNVYQHILSWDTEELKDEFIQKYIFPNFKENWKDVIRKQPTKSLTVLNDISAIITGDYKDFSYFDTEISKQELMNKDIAVVLETDENGNEFFYWYSLDMLPIDTPHKFKWKCELDIFFTYDIKEMLNDNKITINRAMFPRVDENLVPNIFNTVNSFPENFDNDFTDFHIFDKKLNNYSLLQRSYITIPFQKLSYDFKVNDGKNVVDAKVDLWVDVEGNDTSIKFLTQPFCVIAMDQNSYKEKIIKGLIFTEQAYSGEFAVPFNLDLLGFLGAKFNGEYVYNWQHYKNYGSNILSVEKFIDELDEKIFDIEQKFDWKFEGKIYKQPYFKYRLIDFDYNVYEIPLTNFQNEMIFDIFGFITNNSVKCSIKIRDERFTGNNLLYGMENEYGVIGQKSVNPQDTYMAYHKATYENNIKNAKRHSTQQKSQGSMGIIETILNPKKWVSGGSNLANAGSQIANADEELNGLLAQQQSLENSPNQITNGNFGFYENFKNDDMNYNPTNKKTFYEVQRLKPQDILLEKLGWFFHLAGVNFNGMLYNPNELIRNRYYFNFIKATGINENFKLELSSRIKQLADASFTNGITIWHIRDLKTFKGVKNYDVNNVEMEFIKNE